MTAVQKRRVVEISDMLVSNDPSDMLVTYSLGSCVGVSAYDPVRKIAGLAHFQLPLSKMDLVRARTKPAMFVDTGFVELLRQMLELGAAKNRLEIRAAGGAHLMDNKDQFEIGHKNITVLRKILWKNKLMLTSSDLGGSIPRTLSFEVETGLATVQTSGVTKSL